MTSSIPHPWQLFLVILVGMLNREQQRAIGYAKVTVKLQTHRARAVTYNDVELAVRIQEDVLWTPSEESALDGFPKRWVH